MNLNEAYKIFLNGILFTSLIILSNSCQKNNLDRNPYLQEFEFEYSVNLNLPQYDNIKYAGGSTLIPQLGIKGVYLFYLVIHSLLGKQVAQIIILTIVLK